MNDENKNSYRGSKISNETSFAQNQFTNKADAFKNLRTIDRAQIMQEI